MVRTGSDEERRRRKQRSSEAENPVTSLGSVCNGTNLAALEQLQALPCHTWSTCTAGSHAPRGSCGRTVDLQWECCTWAKPWLAGAAGPTRWLSRSYGYEEGAGAFGTTDIRQPVLPPSLTASCRYPVLARVVLAVWNGRQLWRQPSGLVSTFQPARRSSGRILPSPTTLSGFLWFCALGDRKGQALGTSLLAGHGVGC